MTGQQDIEIEKGDFLNRFPCFGHIRGFGGGVCGNEGVLKIVRIALTGGLTLNGAVAPQPAWACPQGNALFPT